MTTDTGMVERAARAVLEADDAWDVDTCVESREQFIARAVLECLRIPTPEMVEAGQTEVNLLDVPGYPEPKESPNAFAFLSKDEVMSMYLAMIDAALNQKGT